MDCNKLKVQLKILVEEQSKLVQALKLWSEEQKTNPPKQGESRKERNDKGRALYYQGKELRQKFALDKDLSMLSEFRVKINPKNDYTAHIDHETGFHYLLESDKDFTIPSSGVRLMNTNGATIDEYRKYSSIIPFGNYKGKSVFKVFNEGYYFIDQDGQGFKYGKYANIEDGFAKGDKFYFKSEDTWFKEVRPVLEHPRDLSSNEYLGVSDNGEDEVFYGYKRGSVGGHYQLYNQLGKQVGNREGYYHIGEKFKGEDGKSYFFGLEDQNSDWGIYNTNGDMALSLTGFKIADLDVITRPMFKNNKFIFIGRTLTNQDKLLIFDPQKNNTRISLNPIKEIKGPYVADKKIFYGSDNELFELSDDNQQIPLGEIKDSAKIFGVIYVAGEYYLRQSRNEIWKMKDGKFEEYFGTAEPTNTKEYFRNLYDVCGVPITIQTSHEDTVQKVFNLNNKQEINALAGYNWIYEITALSDESFYVLGKKGDTIEKKFYKKEDLE